MSPYRFAILGSSRYGSRNGSPRQLSPSSAARCKGSRGASRGPGVCDVSCVGEFVPVACMAASSVRNGDSGGEVYG